MLVRFSPLFSVDGPPAVPAGPPGLFAAGAWSLVMEGSVLRIVISSLPADGGSPITDIQYRIGTGAPVSLGQTTPGSYPSVAQLGDQVQIRAVNAIDPGEWSLAKVLVAPTVTIALAETSYAAGATVDASDLEPVIVAAGTPPLTLGDLTLALLVNGSPVSLPHTAVAGQVLRARAQWTHPGTVGTQTVLSDPVTVGPAGTQATAVDLQAQPSAGADVPVQITGTVGLYHWILTLSNPADFPVTRAQVVAGQTHTGAAAPASGSYTTVANPGTVNADLPNGLFGDYYKVLADSDSVIFDPLPQFINTLVAGWVISGSSIIASPTISPPVVSGSSITG